MYFRMNPMTPLAAVVAGLPAGVAGTVCLVAVHYLKYRRAGWADSALAWEFAPVESWETGPGPRARWPSARSRASPSASSRTVRPG
jgi:hypothetical protein